MTYDPFWLPRGRNPDYDFEDFEDNFGPYKPRNPRRKRTTQKGGETMTDIDFGDPMTLLVIGGLVIGGLRLYQKRWIWESAARAPVGRQLPVGRPGVRRPIVPRPAMARPMLPVGRGMADTNVIASMTTLQQGGPLPNGGYAETISIIGR